MKPSNNKFQKYLKDIPWNQLENLVGTQVLQRGESYFKSRNVTNLVTHSDGLIANVRGSDNYISLVEFREHSTATKLIFQCTCPYRFNCKHAVAVLLTYGEFVKSGKVVPVISSSDSRLKRVKEGPRRDDLEDDFNEEVPSNSVAEFLGQHSKDSLIEMILQLSSRHSELQQDLLDRSRLSHGKTQEIASSIRKEILSIMSTPAWQSHWSNEGHLADFSRVEKNLLNLFNKKDYDVVVELTNFLLKHAYHYIESSNDDGDCAGQIAECLDIGFRALKNSSLSNFEKLFFAVNSQLHDDFEICREASNIIDSTDDKNAWSELADHFYKELKTLSLDTHENFSRNYKRDRISDFLCHALEQADRSNEILPIYEAEAKITNSWVRLVGFLIKNKQHERARSIAEEAIKVTGNKWPGIITSLRTTIAVLAAKQGDFGSILRLKQEDFTDRPSLLAFEALMNTAIKTKNVAEMRDWALCYLTTGSQFTQYEVLIDIAEKEKRVDDVLKLYQQASQKKCSFHAHSKVARIIKDKYPEESLKIWHVLAEQNIDRATPAAYATAVGYLKEAQKIYTKTKRTQEWGHYLDRLKDANKRRPRFLKELRRLTDEKIF